MTTTPLSPAALRSTLDGTASVHTPGDAGYDTARVLEAVGVDVLPTAVVRPTDTAGVVRAVRIARDAGLELAVRSGGHSMLGLGRDHGALALDLRGLDSIEVDPSARTATVGGGVTAGAYTTATAAHGLVTPFGDTGTVGVAGITLGGGVGFLARRLGMTIDSLRSAEVVTADGDVVQADATRHTDLFWGLRGGGGNLGVVTRLTFDLHEQGPVVGGPLMFPATGSSVAALVGALRAAPRELSAIVMVMVCPPVPFVPAENHGTLVAMAHLCFSGDPDEADGVLAPVRDVAARAGGAIVDAVQPTAYSDLLEGPPGPPQAMRVRSFFADDVTEATAGRIVDALRTGSAPMRAVQLRVLGGAVADVAADATAFAHRTAAVTGVVVAAAPTTAEVVEHTAWVRRIAAEVRGERPGAYANFVLDGDPALLAEVYPGTTGERLARLKAAYDPTNVFRGNLNVTPAQPA
ncbi:FAD-binding oxidoreductase [Isoptericola croceus]|uniref:FAD-binding oxidoreductase n=1 Tax=Isoptericola croceus TaxID=3031406 RepID=UPI0023F9B5F5|nr:FAD-binding oxidoreductase [Isoptericola croceus]